MMTWDEVKRQTNIKAHGMDFAGCETVFDHPVITLEDDRLAYGEQRINLLGWWHGQVVHMTYTDRGDNLHVISLRKAEKHEAKQYFRTLSRQPRRN